MQPDADDANLPLRDAWAQRVGRSRDKRFLWTEGGVLTFGAAHDQIARIAHGLTDLGIVQGDIVAVAMANRADDLLLHLALQWVGAVTMPVQAAATFEELAFQLNHSQTRFLFAETALLDRLRPRLGELPGLTQLIATDGGPEASGPTLASLRLAEPLPYRTLAGYSDLSPSALLYTSGSSGRPKGVLVPAGATLSVGEGVRVILSVEARDVVFLPTPLAHAVGLLTALGTCIRCGCALAMVDRFSPSQFWRQADASGATVCCLFPTHLNLLLEATPEPRSTSLRAIYTHAFNAEFVRRFDVDLHMCWGMTETGAMQTMSEGLRTEPAAGYIGKAMAGVEVGCVGADNQPVPAGAVGELRLNHRHVMIGYHRDPESTAKVKHGDWISSGDLGRVDYEGRAYFEGRAKNVIKRSGENISAEEVENVLLQVPGVRECLVFGTPDPLRAEEVVACLRIDTNARLDAAGLLAQAGERLSRFKLPRFVSISQAPLPKLPNGKLDRQTIVSSFSRDTVWDRERGAGALRIERPS